MKHIEKKLYMYQVRYVYHADCKPKDKLTENSDISKEDIDELDKIDEGKFHLQGVSDWMRLIVWWFLPLFWFLLFIYKTGFFSIIINCNYSLMLFAVLVMVLFTGGVLYNKYIISNNIKCPK